MAVFSSSPLSRGESHQCANNQHLIQCMSQPNSSGLMAGVEVLTRNSSAELPYACAFHAHYRTLGVHRILYIISDPEHFSSTASTLQETLAAAGHANGIVVPVFAGPNRALRLFDLSLLEAPYLLSIDMDEYINFQGSESSLPALIESTSQGCMRIKWDISCCDFDNQSRRAAYPSPIFKMAARTRSIMGISGPHAFLMAGDLPSKDERTNTIKLIHYWARSFDDILLKCLFQRFKASKSTLPGQLTSPASHGLPTRLKLLALMEQCRKTLTIPDLLTGHAQEELAHQMVLSKLGEEAWRELVRFYLHYKHSISTAEATSLCKRSSPMALARHLSAAPLDES